ncbi:hypothetical protein Pyn_04910 [Prunus yedoensis var. nudiflora]|uniref:Uncharacterized protein n=1 Tax=Prunus yedoensis var. nudiflora TaxID=2094558 RepID=A0A314YJE0_PRUYE|nr:hypothetical protein Pyn_04910 [Prunus yedoensis var. nudiflora]
MGHEPTEYLAKEGLRVWLEDSKDPKMASEKGLSGLSGKENRPATGHPSVPEPGLKGTHQRVPLPLARRATQEFQ